MSFRNRCTIAGAQGAVHLSIPLEKGRDQRTLVKDVKIAAGYKWQDQHWKTLLASYSRSPWFEHYRDSLEQLYTRSFDFLLDWNLACFEWTLQALAWQVHIHLTAAYQKDYTDKGWIDARGKIVPKLMAEGRAPVWEPLQQVLLTPVRYRQVFEERTGFIPHLSILDLLFCEGKRATTYIKA